MGSTVKVFYDGLCHVCSRQMENYRRKDRGNNFEFVDFTAPGFNATSFGLERKALDRAMHVIDKDGKVYRGIDGFVTIWKYFPRYHWIAALASNPIVKPFFKLGYRIFARLRFYLPKKEKCNDDHCKIPL